MGSLLSLSFFVVSGTRKKLLILWDSNEPVKSHPTTCCKADIELQLLHNVSAVNGSWKLTPEVESGTFQSCAPLWTNLRKCFLILHPLTTGQLLFLF